MPPIRHRRARATWLLAVALAAVAAPLRAAEPWQSLPPTPALPSGTTSHYATIHGARLWYAQWGPETGRVPVLLLHGGLGNSNYFGRLIPALVAKGYPVVAMDSRGHGRSTRRDEPLTYHQMAEDAAALLDLLGIARASVVGWSDGAITGIDLALHHRRRVARLFAFAANADVSGSIDGGDETATFVAYLARARDEYRELSPTPDALASFEVALGTMWASLPAYTAAELGSIRVPVTIADGAYDEVVKPEHTRYLAAAIPHARLVVLPGVSHFAILQDPAAFNAAVLEFLAQR